MDHKDRGQDGGDYHGTDHGKGAALAPGDRAKDDGFEHQADFGKLEPLTMSGDDERREAGRMEAGPL
jgi:hypothetical protein